MVLQQIVGGGFDRPGNKRVRIMITDRVEHRDRQQTVADVAEPSNENARRFHAKSGRLEVGEIDGRAIIETWFAPSNTDPMPRWPSGNVLLKPS